MTIILPHDDGLDPLLDPNLIDDTLDPNHLADQFISIEKFIHIRLKGFQRKFLQEPF